MFQWLLTGFLDLELSQGDQLKDEKKKMKDGTSVQSKFTDLQTERLASVENIPFFSTGFLMRHL